MNVYPSLVVDLETCPIDRASEFIEPPSAPANYKDADKIAAYIAEATTTAIERCSLHPDLGRIVALGWMLEGRDIEPVVVTCRTEVAEARALREFWREAVLPNGAHRRLITFNGNGFDLPYLMRRSLYLGVVYPHLNIDRYRSPHIDLMTRLSFNGVLKAQSLAFYAKRFSLPVETDTVHGADVPALVREGSDASWDAIAAHCRSDVLTTYLLASRLQYVDYDEDVQPAQPGAGGHGGLLMTRILTIDRTRWRRGSDRQPASAGPTLLLNDQGFLCCLGFDALARGCVVGEILNKTEPGEVAEAPEEYHAYRRLAKETIGDAIAINDDERITDAEREKKLVPVMQALGWDEVRFRG